MSSFKESQYQCSVCTRIRLYKLNVREHEQKVALSENGLVIYSDIHRCENGILGINNLHVDHDFAIRSFDNLQLPRKRRPLKSSIPGLPLPVPTTRIDEQNKLKTYLITKILDEKDFRIRIIDERLRVIITIGDIRPKKEKMIAFITSDLGTIELEYYDSAIPFHTGLEKWLNLLVNLLEKLPPTTIGLFIETLMFIHSLSISYTQPSIFLIKQLKTLITSHETYFLLQEDPKNITEKISYVAAKYGEEVASVMNKLLSYLVANPMIPLQYYTRTHSEDLVYLINLFLILEQEGLLVIERPGIVEEEVEAELAIKE